MRYKKILYIYSALLIVLSFFGCSSKVLVHNSDGSSLLVDNLTGDAEGINFRSKLGIRVLNLSKVDRLEISSTTKEIYSGESWVSAIVSYKKLKFGSISDTGWVKASVVLVGDLDGKPYNVDIKKISELNCNYKKNGGKSKAGSKIATPVEADATIE